MYFFRSSPFAILLIFFLGVLWWSGGWLLGRAAFRLKLRERAAVGLGLGFLLHLVFANLFAWIMPFEWAYPLGCVMVLIMGITFRGRRLSKSQAFVEIKTALRTLPPFLILLVIFLLINRGLAIFDEGYNLPIVSQMAAGDVPPHFFLYPSQVLPYHYGLHLFAAALTRRGGLFPWSAFDFARAFTHALMLILAALWFWRMTQRWLGGIIGATLPFAIFQGRPLKTYPSARLEEALDTLYSLVKKATEGNKEVLFITERHLLTFGYFPDVPLVADYEKVWLMEMAMANHRQYLEKFYTDLAKRRFAMIVTTQTFVSPQGDIGRFGDENRAWRKRVNRPILCYYKPYLRFREFNFEILLPREKVQQRCR